MTHIHYEKDIVTTQGGVNANAGAGVGTQQQFAGQGYAHGQAQAAGSQLVGGQTVITNQYSQSSSSSQGGYAVP